MKNFAILIKSGILVGLLLLVTLPLVPAVSTEASVETSSSCFSSQDDTVVYQKTRSDSEDFTPSQAKIKDPTGKTEGYLLADYSENTFELIGSRGQTFRHFYNKTSKAYTYQSDTLVQKEGVLEETVWVTAEEYPHRFLLWLQNGEVYFFDTASEITNFLNTIDRATIWAVGFESFSGVMGFYLNFQDTVNGHAQYLYWPRLSNGRIPPYNMPSYALYPHLYAKTNGDWMDRILTDCSLYHGVNQIPTNTLEFYHSDSEFGVFFSLAEVNIQETTWNFKHGFKYRLDDQSFHMITEFDCVDKDFEDIGLTYEITPSPQSKDTSHNPTHFILQSELESVVVAANETWDAGQYLDNYDSQIDIISETNDQCRFAFDDMELTGFTEKHLEFHDQLMPDGSVRKVLSAGMYGFGYYSRGSWIEIDPEISPSVFSTNNYDLYRDSLTWITGTNYFRVGDKNNAFQSLWIAFNTGITDYIYDTCHIALKLYCVHSSFDLSSEGAKCRVYNIGGNANEDTAKENSTSYKSGTNRYTDNLVYKGDIGTGSYKTAAAAEMEKLIDYWAENRNTGENYISFSMTSYGPETDDYYSFRTSEYTGTDCDPKLSFSYVTEDHDYWALIVAGSYQDIGGYEPEPWYEPAYRMTYEALKIYQTLNDTYEGYTDENMYLLAPYDTVWGETVPYDRTTSEANFKWAVEEIASFSDSGDQVLIFWTGHGGTDELDACGDTITASELNGNLSEIDCAEMFIIIETCHSGSLIDDLNETSNRVIYTACNSSQGCYGWEAMEEGWLGGWFSNATIRALDPDFNASDADTNSDNRISLFEMFQFANQTIMDLNDQYGHDVRPQRWVGATISDDSTVYIYDGYYQ
jgi:hypothetical protein